MPIENSNDKQRLLNEIISALSKDIIDKNEMQSYLDKLAQIYDGGFKHKYSDFYHTIVDVFKDDNNMDSEFLLTNLYELSAYFEQPDIDPKYINIKKPFTKLCDHLNLQISQFNYYNITNNRIMTVNNDLEQLQKAVKDTEQLLKESRTKLAETEVKYIDITKKSEEIEAKLKNVTTNSEEMEKKLQNVTKKLQKARKQVKSSQVELISVLSIFAAIVITFASGFSFLESSLTSLKDIVYYEVVVLVIIICGMVIFNTIFLLMFLMARITKRSISTRCRKSTCNDCTNCTEQCKWLSQVKIRLPYVYYFNYLALLGIIIDLIVWIIDIHSNWI